MTLICLQFFTLHFINILVTSTSRSFPFIWKGYKNKMYLLELVYIQNVSNYQNGIKIILIVTMIIINQLQHYWKNILVNMSIHTNDTNDENNDTWIYIHGFIHMSKLWWAWIICYGHSIISPITMRRTLLLWASLTEKEEIVELFWYPT